MSRDLLDTGTRTVSHLGCNNYTHDITFGLHQPHIQHCFPAPPITCQACRFTGETHVYHDSLLWGIVISSFKLGYDIASNYTRISMFSSGDIPLQLSSVLLCKGSPGSISCWASVCPFILVPRVSCITDAIVLCF